MSLGGTPDFAMMAAVIGCVVRSAARHGFGRIFVLNGHGGNISALDTILTELTIELKLPLAGGTYWHIAAESIRGILEHQPQLLHACEAETSILQALSPELVAPLDASMQGALVPGMSAIAGVNPGVFRWQHLKTRSAIGVLGAAWAATPEKGHGSGPFPPTWPTRLPISDCGTRRSDRRAIEKASPPITTLPPASQHDKPDHAQTSCPLLLNVRRRLRRRSPPGPSKSDGRGRHGLASMGDRHANIATDVIR